MSRRKTTTAIWYVMVIVALIATACGTDRGVANAGDTPAAPSTTTSDPATAVSSSSASSTPDFNEEDLGESCQLIGLLPGMTAYVIASSKPGAVPVPDKVERPGTLIERRMFSVTEFRAGNGEPVADLTGDQEFAVVTGFADGGAGRGFGNAVLDASSLGLLLAPLAFGEPGELDIRAVVSFDEFGEPVFVGGRCAERHQQQLVMVANHMGLDRETVLRGWISADLDPATGLNLYGRMIYEAERAARNQAGEDAWHAADPTRRSLDPGDVPAAVLATLDVLAVQLDIKGVAPDEVLLIRSDSGASVAVAGAVLPILQPAFFTPSDRQVELLLGSSTDDPEPRLLAAIDLDARTSQGFLLTGTIESPVLEPLSDEAIASLAGLSSAADLAALRGQLLGR